MRRRGAHAVALTVWLGLARAAAADDHPPGFEPSIYVGVGGFANGLRFDGPAWASGELVPALGLQVDLAYRFGPAFDVGLHVFHQWISVHGVEAGSDTFATAPGAGLLARVHPLTALFPRLPLDLAIGSGFDFSASARQTTETHAGGTTTEERASVTGFSVPVWLGLDYVAGGTALGIVGVWAPWWRAEECHAVGTGLPECRRETSAPEHYLFVGLGVRVHLDFVQ